MRWQGRRQSRNIEDRRGQRGGGGFGIPISFGTGRGGGGGRGIPLTGGGLVTLLVIMGVIWLLGGNPLSIFGLSGGGPSGPSSSIVMPSGSSAPPTDAQAQFIATVLADTEDVWTDLFAQRGLRYAPPTLVLFRDGTQSGCGYASSAVGPFYCPADRKIYIDLSFYDLLAERLNAPGDFAQAYVLAHEVAHHVQHLLGTTDHVHGLQRNARETEANELSVRLELQADFLAGVWAHHAHERWQILEPGDIDEAIRAAGAVGDDYLQRKQQGHVVPDSFTHGTSEQRIRWFKKGFDTGDPEAGDTFSIDDL